MMKLFKFNHATFMCIFLAATLALVSSDFSKDKGECQQQLVSLSSCINYVTNEVKSPSPQCCKILYKQINVTKKCLCTLVKDRNEPSLGLKLNATRALMLPSICRAASNSRECIGLLHLDPKSSEARIFIESANITGGDDIYGTPSNPRTNGGTPKMRTFEAFLLWSLVLAFLLNLLINY